MFKTLVNAFKNKEIRTKILWTLLLLLAFRVGCFVPIPGLSMSAVKENIASGVSLMSVLNAVTGGSLSQGTLFALGIVPYINASIIIQLLTMVIPAFERWSKQGDEGRKKMSKATRIAAMILALVQSIGIVLGWGDKINAAIMFGNQTLATIAVIILMTAGSALCMWLSERITEHGISNGSSLIIFVGIISTAGQSIYTALTTISASNLQSLWILLEFILVVVVLFALIIFVDSGERRINVTYAKQVKGNKMYGGQNTNIPIRVNASGVMPIIFASALMMFPQMVLSLWGADSEAYIWWSQNLGAGTWVYTILTPVIIVFFAYFYQQMQFQPEDIARNIQQHGGMILGIRPGKPTAEHLRKINNRITLFGALFLALLVLIPSVIFNIIGADMLGLNNAFTSTGLLIVVSVALEVDKQLESQIMMKHYKGILK
ncbi:MAG: preprotein translocase subunit SecY [Clostridia bacterium]|nr:preprotein translocase subunit SecY [Clostridia bacterium]